MDFKRQGRKGRNIGFDQRRWQNHRMVNEKRPWMQRSHVPKKTAPKQQKIKCWKHELQICKWSFFWVLERIIFNVSGYNRRRCDLQMLKELHSTVFVSLHWSQWSSLQSQSKSILLRCFLDMFSWLELQTLELEKRSTLKHIPKFGFDWWSDWHLMESKWVDSVCLSL
mgnify:CR=1 FL=1